MAWTRHNAGVRLIWTPQAGGQVTVDLPVHTLTVTPEPYSGAGVTVVTLFDGRRVMEPMTYGYKMMFEWPLLRETDSLALGAALDAFAAHGPADIVYLDKTGVGTYDPAHAFDDVIVDLGESQLGAQFEARLRTRPASLTLLTQSQALPRQAWIES